MGTDPSRRLAEAAPVALVGAPAWLVAPLDAAAVVAGLVLAVVVHGLLARGLARRGLTALGPADRVTLLRAWLTCGVAALVVDGHGAGGIGGGGHRTALLLLAATALVLDAVDGPVARRTGTVSALGARFDMEVDALLILVLSVSVARTTGWWVLTIGLARYAVLAAAAVAPWLRAGVAAQSWRKLVAAIQGVVLTVAAGGLLPPVWTTFALLVAGVLLAVSFLTEVAALWRTRALGVEVRPAGNRRPDRRLTVGAS